jgi:hypothetical protein
VLVVGLVEAGQILAVCAAAGASGLPDGADQGLVVGRIVSVVLRHGSEVLLSIGPWQQLIDVAVWMTVDDPGEDVG